MCSTFQVEMPVRSLFEHSTVEALASLITQQQAALFEQTKIDSLLAESDGLSEAEAQWWLVDEAE